MTVVSALVSFARSNPSPSIEGLPSSKGGAMSGKVLYVKFVLLMVAVAAIALAVGSDPWGPN